MKHTKIISILMAIIVLFSFATNVYAENTTPSITIDKAVDGQTYSVYKLFDLYSYSGDNYCYILESGDEWYDFFKTGAGSQFVDIDDTDMITWKDGTKAEELAPLALQYAKDNGIAATKSATKKENETLVFEGLELGYYLVDSTVGTLCSLNTTNPTATIGEKNLVPQIYKEVKEDANGVWGETNTAAVGEKVEFRAIITVAAGTAELVMHDTMSEGFIFNNDVKVFKDNGEITKFTVNNACNDGCTFEVTIDGDYVKGLKAGTELVVTYSATVDTDAVIAGEGNLNEVKLVYGENKDLVVTPSDKTTTFVWEFDLYKYAVESENKIALAGATFSLYTDEATANIVNFADLGGNVYQNKADGTVTTFTTDASGKINLTGLDAGIYYLKEITAPEGYNRLKAPVKIEIDSNGNVKQDGNATNIVEIENKTGSLLPSTGGIGTYLFYGIGGALILVAIVLLIAKKRMGSSK